MASREVPAAPLRCTRPIVAMAHLPGGLRLVMAVEHGRRLAGPFPNARLMEMNDSYTLPPHDHSAVLAVAIRTFLEET